jgi:hypothetical protein
VNALVDIGAGVLVITELVCQKLGPEIKGLHSASLADNEKVVCKVTNPADIRWKDRKTPCGALVISGGDNIPLGAIPLEDRDLWCIPRNKNYGARAATKLLALSGSLEMWAAFPATSSGNAILPVAFWHSANPDASFPAGETKKNGCLNAGTT